MTPTESAPTPLRTLATKAGAVLVFGDAESASIAAAGRIAEVVRAVVSARGQAVLGLATGGTPRATYRRLVELHREGTLSFRDVETFNLDEFLPISPLDPRSYRAYMHEHLFSQVDIDPGRAHVLDGTVPASFAAEACDAFDRWIAEAGGLDLQLLGVGRNGHIGFNEPSDLPVEQALALPSRPIALHPTTTADAAKEFGGDPAHVPERALTVGTATILRSRAILVLAFGAGKSEAVAAALTGPMTAEVPASLLQSARDRVTWMLDEAAADRL